MRLVQKIVFPVGIMMAVSLGTLAWVIQSRSAAALEEAAQKELAAQSGRYANYIQGVIEVGLNESAAMANALARIVEGRKPLSRDAVIHMLSGMTLGSENLVGAATLWEPNAFDGKDYIFAEARPYPPDGRFNIYAAKKEKGVELRAATPENEYYTLPHQTGERCITSPYTSRQDGQDMLLVTASVPVNVRGTFRGVVCTDISLAALAEAVASIRLYQSGYGVLLSREGNIIAHQDASRVGTSIFDVTTLADPAALRAAMNAGEPYLERRLSGTGQEALCYYQPVQFRGTQQRWYLMTSAPVDEALASANTLTRLALFMSAGVLFLVLAVIVLVARSTARPIIYLSEVAQKIAAGELSTPIHDERFGGEVRQLGTSLKAMIASLVDSLAHAESMKADAQAQAARANTAMEEAESAGREANAKSEAMLRAADKLEDVAGIVSSESSALSVQIAESERGASTQASRVAETAAAMEKVNASVLEVAKNAGIASEFSLETRRKAEEGSIVVKKAVESIQEVQKEALALKAEMETLSRQAQEISTIINVISDIADQTNLLALNAAIEAARAGEAGRGFAVVADEVRKLAEKTMVSTTNVGNAIRSIQEGAARNMEQVALSVRAVEEATRLAEESGEALTQIVSMVDNTADQVRAIAASSEEQSASSEEINRSLGQMDGIASETARAMEAATQSVTELSKQVHTLSRLIEEMKQD